VQALLEGALLCNDSHLNRETDAVSGKEVFTPNGAPTEVSLITAGLKAGVIPSELTAAKPRVAAVPFESEHKVCVWGGGGRCTHGDAAGRERACRMGAG
jgi:magnesium-transporting ATPase (P-type)